MSPEEIKKIVYIAIKFGINNIKITGGEPLLRDDLETIITNLKSFKSILSAEASKGCLDPFEDILGISGIIKSLGSIFSLSIILCSISPISPSRIF